MIDFLRNDTNDITFTDTVFQIVPDKKTQVKQRLELRLKRFLGEYFLDTRKGVDYFGVVKVKNPDIEVINSALKAEVFKEEAVTEIIQWDAEIDPANRVFKVLDTSRVRIDTTEIVEFGVEV
jgi:hypothetical protein